MPSPNAELVAECLATMLEVVPLLDERDLDHVATHHPWATPDWLAGIHAMSQGQPAAELAWLRSEPGYPDQPSIDTGRLDPDAGTSPTALALHPPTTRLLLST